MRHNQPLGVSAEFRGDSSVLHQNSLQLQHDCAFRDSWSGHTSFAGMLGDPLPCYPTALVGTSLVLVDRDREPTASGAHEGIAHETLYRPDEPFHFSFVLLQEVEKRLRAFAGTASIGREPELCREIGNPPADAVDQQCDWRANASLLRSCCETASL